MKMFFQSKSVPLIYNQIGNMKQDTKMFLPCDQ